MNSPKSKKAKKNEEPSQDEVKPKKAKKNEEPSQDDVISPKIKSVKKTKEVSSKTKKVKKNEEPSEEEVDSPKPKKMKKEKEMNGEIGEKSPKLKNGFSHSGLDSNSSEAASEESNSELEQVRFRYISFQINK